MHHSFKLSLLPLAGIVLLAAGTTSLMNSRKNSDVEDNTNKGSGIELNLVSVPIDPCPNWWQEPDTDEPEVPPCPPLPKYGSTVAKPASTPSEGESESEGESGDSAETESNPCNPPAKLEIESAPVPAPASDLCAAANNLNSYFVPEPSGSAPPTQVGFPTGAGMSLVPGLPPSDFLTPSLNGNKPGVSSTQIRLDSPSVSAADGSLVQLRTDMAFPGGAAGFRLGRVYRSSLAGYNGFIGAGWELNILKRIRVTGTDAVDKPTGFWSLEGSGRESGVFREVPGNTDWLTNTVRDDQYQYQAATGADPQKLTHFQVDGSREIYSRMDLGSDWYHLIRKEDIWGNGFALEYTYGLANSPTLYTLTKVIDDLNREFLFQYDSTDGRLERVEAWSGSKMIGEVDYTYEIKYVGVGVVGTVLLSKVEKGMIPTEGANGGIVFVRETETYQYGASNSAQELYDYWRLSRLVNGAGEATVAWEYFTGTNEGKISKQTDRPGGIKRGEGVHSYTYGPLQTTYVGPDGDTREFNIDNKGRIIARIEHPDAQTSLTTTFSYDNAACGVCSKIEQITYPDQSYEFFQYNDNGYLTTHWSYPVPGTSLTPRVERWSWSGFDPISGQMRMKMLEHELRRDANPVEDPDHPCNHPSCVDLLNADGHHVVNYNWSVDEKSLDSIDFGTMQSGVGTSAAFLNRETAFTYFSDGRLSVAREMVDGTEIANKKFFLSTNKAYVDAEETEDTVQGETWTVHFTVNPDTFFVESVTSVDGVVAKYHTSSSGRLYRIEEDVSGVSAARTSEFRFDSAGRLAQSSIAASDGSSLISDYSVDESGLPYEVETVSQGGPLRLTKLTFSVGGNLLFAEDWRGWKTEIEYGFGSWGKPIKLTETDGSGNTRIVWQVGDGGADTGYDNRGRLTSSRNVAGWKSYLAYDARGRVKYVFNQADATHYSAQAYFYDVRGFLKEKEVGSLDGNPSSFTLADLTWLQHIVYSKNLFGHLMSLAVYESGATNEARLVQLELDGRGRPVKTTRFQGDRTNGSAPVAVVAEVDFDALNRPLQVRLMENATSVAPIKIIDRWYEDSLRKVTTMETLGVGGPELKVEKLADSLGRLISTTQFAYEAGMWTSSRSWQYGYDGLDNLKTITEPLGKITELMGNDLGQLLYRKVSDSTTTLTTSYQYDALTGALNKIIDASGSETLYEVYSEWLRPKKVTHPDGRTFEIKAYDDLGRRTQTLDSRGVEHNYAYDNRYLLSDSVAKPTGGVVVPGPDALSWQYDRDKGTVLSSRVWENGSVIWRTDFAHNDLGEKLTETQGVGTDAMTWAWTYGYAGEVVSANYPSGLGIDNGAFAYDASGRMDRIQYWKGATLLADDSIGYEGFRTTGRDDVVSGISTAFRYDSFGRLDRAEWSKLVGGNAVVLDGQERAFDLASRVTSRQRLLGSTGDVFKHDGFGRMQDWYRGVAQANANPANTIPASWADVDHYKLTGTYGRDEVTTEESGGNSTIHDYGENFSHFYSNVDGKFRTQQDGRLNHDGSHYFRWDGWGRLSEVEDNAFTTIRIHHYDAEGRRIQTEELDQGITKRLVYWGARLAATFIEGSTNSEVRTYGYAGGSDGESFVEVSASGVANGSYALARDFQGSILALIDRTTGTVVEKYSYGAFGAVTIKDAGGAPLVQSAYGNSRFFLGKPYDAVVGIYDLRARWYDSATGSFLSPDPMGPVDSWNLYQYGFGTPGTWMDPFGLQGGLGPGGVRQGENVPGMRPPQYDGPFEDNLLNNLGGRLKSGIDMVGNAGGAVVEFAWEAPSTAAGVGWMGIGSIAAILWNGEFPEFSLDGENLIMLNNPIMNGGGITLGRTETYSSRLGYLFHRLHESWHHEQSKAMGPTYLPGMALGMFFSLGASFVRDPCDSNPYKNAPEGFGKWAHQFNPFELGPQTGSAWVSVSDWVGSWK